MPTITVCVSHGSPLIGKKADEISAGFHIDVLEVRKSQSAWNALPREAPVAEHHVIRASGQIGELKKFTSAAWNLHERRKLKR